MQATVLRNPRTRAVLIGIAAVLVLAALLLLAAALVLRSGWFEQRVERHLGEITERAVHVSGLSLRLGRPLRVHVETLRIANPDWAHTAHLIDARGIDARIRVWPLTRGRVVVDDLLVASGHAGLERESDRRTWRLPTRNDAPERVDVNVVRVEDGWVYYRDADRDTVLHIHTSGAVGDPNGRMDVRAKGRFRGEPAAIHARAPSLRLTRERPLDVWMAASVGATAGIVDGTIQLGEAGEIRRLEGDIELAGPSLATLEPLIGFGAPATPPYRFAGRVRHADALSTFDPFALHIGGSDVQGRLTWDATGQRPLARGEIVSQVLALGDLAEVLGPAPDAPQDRVFPTQALPTERLQTVDAKVAYRAEQIEGWRRVGVGSLEGELLLSGGVLELPLQVELAGGRLNAKIVLDGTERTPRGDLNVDAHALELARFFPVEAAAPGRIHGNIALTGFGESVAAMLGSANGRVSAALSGGNIPRLLAASGVDPDRVLVLLSTTQADTPLRCAAADFAVKGGVASANVFIIDTPDVLIEVEGQVNLATEAIDLVTNPHAKDPGVFKTRPPVHITGTLADPDYGLYTPAVARRLGLAGLLAALAPPLLAVAPFVELGVADDANCGALVREVKQAGPIGASR